MKVEQLKQILNPSWGGEVFTWDEIVKKLNAHEASRVIHYGVLEIDNFNHTCRIMGDEIKLTGIQFKILRTLASALGEMVGRVELTEAVYGRYTYSNSRSMDANISHLRKKLKDKPVYMKTVHGAGLRIVAEQY